jgi:hypothetical protein
MSGYIIFPQLPYDERCRTFYFLCDIFEKEIVVKNTKPIQAAFKRKLNGLQPKERPNGC